MPTVNPKILQKLYLTLDAALQEAGTPEGDMPARQLSYGVELLATMIAAATADHGEHTRRAITAITIQRLTTAVDEAADAITEMYQETPDVKNH